MIDFTKIDVGKQVWEKAEEFWKEQVEDGDLKIEEVESIKKEIQGLSIIVSFGEGFWGGSDDEHVLVYHKQKKCFFWFSLYYGHDRFRIKCVPKTDVIFSFLQNIDKNYHQFTEIDQYFKTTYHDLQDATLLDAGIQAMNVSAFVECIWWDITREFSDSRKWLEKQVKVAKRTEEQKKNKRFYETYQHAEIELVYENGKLYVVFDKTEKKEIV